MEHHQETFHQLEQIQVQNKLPQHSRQLHYISAKEIKAFKYNYIQPTNSDPLGQPENMKKKLNNARSENPVKTYSQIC